MKEKMHFSIIINAPCEKVWDIMLSDVAYRQWTDVFNPGSYFKGSWEEGSRILFLGPNPDGSGEGGMVSCIKESRIHEFVSIEHVGVINNGVEDTTSEEAKKWSSMYENYTFTKKGAETQLDVDIEMPSNPESKAMKEIFEGMWPKALLKLKEICEK
jgi:uncharacterized protein YndB with AHSA1/START domain